MSEKNLLRFVIAALVIGTLIVAADIVLKLHQRNAEPVISVVGGNIYDAGRVSRAQAVVHTFQIVNASPIPVRLAVPVAGCTCTTATTSASVIPANGSARVTLTVQPEDGNIAGSATLTATSGQKSTTALLLVTGQIAK